MEQWIAFSVSRFNGDEPTIEYLLEFERKELLAKKSASVKKSSNVTSASVAATSFQGDDDDDEMLGAYICNTPKVGGYFHSIGTRVFFPLLTGI